MYRLNNLIQFFFFFTKVKYLDKSRRCHGVATWMTSYIHTIFNCKTRYALFFKAINSSFKSKLEEKNGKTFHGGQIVEDEDYCLFSR